jgi:hypothetical protein
MENGAYKYLAYPPPEIDGFTCVIDADSNGMDRWLSWLSLPRLSWLLAANEHDAHLCPPRCHALIPDSRKLPLGPDFLMGNFMEVRTGDQVRELLDFVRTIP